MTVNSEQQKKSYRKLLSMFRQHKISDQDKKAEDRDQGLYRDIVITYFANLVY